MFAHQDDIDGSSNLDDEVHLVSLWPAHKLEELAGLRGRLHPCHQLGERDDLLVDLEDPRPDDGNGGVMVGVLGGDNTKINFSNFFCFQGGETFKSNRIITTD